ncbi:MAG: 4'-phosphopantetheinyl transferase superfamily protein [Oleiphilaceae bacterium]|nr:4'-phosphopantetheinyl transferase superfamily protein [Oleiphilaceae bacterium]
MTAATGTAGPRLYWRSLDGDLPQSSQLNSEQRARLATLVEPGRRREYRHSRELLMGALAAENPLADPEQVAAVGPPRLPLGCGLHGALAHSQGLAVCALHRAAVGLDLEHRQRRPPWQRLASRWFSQCEQDCLNAMTVAMALDRFLLLWTLKEAWLKATHQGIANTHQQLQLAAGGTDPSDWQLTLPPGQPGWQAAAVDFRGYWLSLFWQGRGTSLPRPPEKSRPWRLLTDLACRPGG